MFSHTGASIFVERGHPQRWSTSRFFYGMGHGVTTPNISGGAELLVSGWKKLIVTQEKQRKEKKIVLLVIGLRKSKEKEKKIVHTERLSLPPSVSIPTGQSPI